MLEFSTLAIADSLGVAWRVAPELVTEIECSQRNRVLHREVLEARIGAASRTLGRIRRKVDHAAQRVCPNSEVIFRFQKGRLEVRPYDSAAQSEPNLANLCWHPTSVDRAQLRQALGAEESAS